MMLGTFQRNYFCLCFVLELPTFILHKGFNSLVKITNTNADMFALDYITTLAEFEMNHNYYVQFLIYIRFYRQKLFYPTFMSYCIGNIMCMLFAWLKTPVILMYVFSAIHELQSNQILTTLDLCFPIQQNKISENDAYRSFGKCTCL